MRLHAILALAITAGAADSANAQTANVSYTVTFVETLVGTNIPVASPNIVLEPGESLRIQISELITPDVGSMVTYVPPPGPGVGTVAGFGDMEIALLGTGDTHGEFTHVARASGFATGVAISPNFERTGFDLCQAAQILFPGETANPTNPVSPIWRCVWTPDTYTSRTITFTTAPSPVWPEFHSLVIVQYGVDPNGDPLYAYPSVGATFGSGSFQVAPAPPTVAIIGLGILAAASRRNRENTQ